MLKPRVMFFSHVCQPSFLSGAEKTSLFMLRELKEKSHCMLVVPCEGMLAREARKLGINVTVTPYPVMWSFLKPRAYLADLEYFNSGNWLDSLEQLLNLKKPDLVIANTSVNFLPPMAAKKNRIPVIWWMQEVVPKNRFTDRYIEMVTQYADWVLGSSQAALYWFKDQSFARKRLLLYPSWHMDDLRPASWDHHRQELRNQLGLKKSAKAVGYISAKIARNKGLVHFIEMAKLLCRKEDNVHFLIRANQTPSNYSERCFHLIRKSGYEERFHIIPFKRHIEEIYPAMDVVVVPSQVEEGFGLTALEGMIFGKPVVAYNAGGLREILNLTGNRRFLIQKENIGGLKSRVNELVRNNKMRSRVGFHNQKAVQRVFGIESYRQRLHKILIKTVRGY